MQSVVRINANQVSIERRMMDLRQGDSIGHHRVTILRRPGCSCCPCTRPARRVRRAGPTRLTESRGGRAIPLRRPCRKSDSARIGAHESISNGVHRRENLLMHIALIVVPHSPAWPRKHRLDRQEVFHLRRLENTALRTYQRYPLAPILKSGRQIASRQTISKFN